MKDEDYNSTFDSADWADRGRLRYTDDESRKAEQARQVAKAAYAERLASLRRRFPHNPA